MHVKNGTVSADSAAADDDDDDYQDKATLEGDHLKHTTHFSFLTSFSLKAPDNLACPDKSKTIEFIITLHFAIF